MSRSSCGFTLIELMVSVAIVCVLTSLALPSYQHYVDRSEAKGAQLDLLSLALLLDSDYQRELAFPALSLSDKESIRARYRAWNPSQVSYGFKLSSTSTGYTLTATGTKGGNTGCTIVLTQAQPGSSDCAGSKGNWL